MSAASPILVLRCPGKKPIRMGPGGRIRIGRHASNDLVLSDDTVSRFHAEIGWDPDEDRPHVVDNDSANGVEVDGDLIDVKAHLPGGNQVVVGRFTLVIEVIGLDGLNRRESGVDIMIPDLNDSDSVVLYTERKEERLTGHATTTAELHRMLLDLESEQRTGTLTLRGSVQTRVTFCQGLIMTAQHGSLSGREALEEIFYFTSAIYGFTRELRPVDEPLNLSVKHYLETELRERTKKVIVHRDGQTAATSESPTRPRGETRPL